MHWKDEGTVLHIKVISLILYDLVLLEFAGGCFSSLPQQFLLDQVVLLNGGTSFLLPEENMFEICVCAGAEHHEIIHDQHSLISCKHVLKRWWVFLDCSTQFQSYALALPLALSPSAFDCSFVHMKPVWSSPSSCLGGYVWLHPGEWIWVCWRLVICSLLCTD